MEKGCGFFARIGLETRVGVSDDKDGTESREQTRLQERVRLFMGQTIKTTYENQGGVGV